MKIERIKNASRNIVFGTILKLYQMIIPFITRTAVIYILGVKYVGLSGLFSSILQILNLAELGVGSAMVFSMYRPIAEDDEKSICALMKLYRIYYSIIGTVICAAGLILLPFIPKLINDTLPDDVNVYVLYLLNLAATVFSYWLFAYKNSIIIAHQRVDVTNKIMLVTETLKFVLQIAAIAVFRNYYWFVAVILFIQILSNIITAVCATKMYPKYKAKGKLPKGLVHKINRRIRDLLTAKFGSIIVYFSDTIIISAFLGLTTLAVYQNYFYPINAVIGIVSVVFSSCTAGIGNSLIIESENKNFNDLNTFTFIIAWIGGFGAVCFLCLLQPFMELWVGQDLMLDLSVVICLCVYFFVFEINTLLNLYKDAAGMWHEDRWRPLITSLANLALNLTMVQIWGLYGVILSTVVSTLCIGLPWLIHNLFTVIFEKKYIKNYLLHLFFYTAVSLAVCAVTYFICGLLPLPTWLLLIVRAMICCIVPNALFFAAYRKMPEFAQTLELADKMTNGRFNKIFKKLVPSKKDN